MGWGILFGNYKKVGVIYENKESGTKIFEMMEKSTKITYALKRIGPFDDSTRKILFKRESHALKKLNKYDNIVNLYNSNMAIGRKDNKVYGFLLLENIPGKSMDKIVYEEEDLNEIDKYTISIGIIDAIINAHNNNILHRDIKPSNIMIYDKVKVKVIDFGISKIKTLIDDGTVQDMKSKDYCAPEVSLRADASELSDIYSIGAVIYKLFTRNNPPEPSIFVEAIDNSSMNSKLKEIIKSMVQVDKEQRECDLEKIRNEIKALKSERVSITDKYSFNLDSNLFHKLKERNVINKSISINEFTKKTLKEDFKEVYGLINKDGEYEFLGEKYIIKCIYEKNNFYISELYIPLEDQRLRFKKKATILEGLYLFNDKNITSCVNELLKIKLENYEIEYKSKKNQNTKFYDYFVEWKNYLSDSIDNEKNKCVEFSIKGFVIKGDILKLNIEEFFNKDIDSIKDETCFIIEYCEKDKPRYIKLGELERIENTENELYLYIKLNNRSPVSKIKRLLKDGKTIKEDYMYKISAYQKQIKAIDSLYEDTYEANNLKNIILDISEPQKIDEIGDMVIKGKLNTYQVDAVKKFIASDSISLIQGPPGTGKTSVINTIIEKVLEEEQKYNNVPKILVVSQSHTAVDNILEGILKRNKNIKVFRVGAEKDIATSIKEEFTLESLKEKFEKNVNKHCQEYRDSIGEFITQDYTNSEDKISKILQIQDQWMERIKTSDDIEYQIINDAVIVAGTCIGFSSNFYIRDIPFDYVIVDEAAKATTPELLVSMIKAKKILLVGDHMQLPPYVDANGIKWVDKEMMKRLKTSLFTNLYGILPKTHRQRLKIQYRMHTNIGNLISHVFYDNDVENGVDDKEKQHPITEYKQYSIIWLDTSNIGEGRKHKPTIGKSYINRCEVEIIKQFIKENIEVIEKSNKNIGIITGYSAQRDSIKRSINNYNLSNNISVNTVDAFQGREKDIIFYSTVRSSEDNSSIGFQKEAERINVAFSRAKELLIIVGDLIMFDNWNIDENKFPEIIDFIKENEDKCLIVDCSKEEKYGQVFRKIK